VENKDIGRKYIYWKKDSGKNVKDKQYKKSGKNIHRGKKIYSGKNSGKKRYTKKYIEIVKKIDKGKIDSGNNIYWDDGEKSGKKIVEKIERW